ncbi:hypothetical protein BCR39DRAFT_544529 [Naematelia encephala]|uniref:AAA+ ATPase domain-containing protein n=1 Tax=Naematelia encephala TaxID=71784 RepID=A0A1Y2ARZ1_9TREE|nr:hypothetical protein BCR39DRAFT_544529 [Naematelia encephala]
MRRVAPASLRRQICPSAARARPPSSTFTPLKQFTSSPLHYYPRSKPRAARNLANDDDDSPNGFPSSPGDEPEDHVDPSSDGSTWSPGGQPPSSPSFASIVTSIIPPAPSDTPLPDELRPVLAHVLATFLPANQNIDVRMDKRPRKSTPSAGGAFMPNIHGMNIMQMQNEGSEEQDEASESVLALVSPFEGGGHYNLQAVQRIAAEIDAEVQRVELVMGVGLDGPSSPLGSTGRAAPPLPSNVNPLLNSVVRPSPSPESSPPPMPMEEEEMESGDEGESSPSAAMMVLPMGGRGFGLPTPSSPKSANGIQDDWVKFFEHLINTKAPDADDSAKKRIILLDSPEAMSDTFDAWWPSLVEAVHRRRKGQPAGKTKKAVAPRPTTVILSSAPSMLASHTAPFASSEKETSGVERPPIQQALQELAERYGGTLESREHGQDDVPLWWGSEEEDIEGRTKRNQRRLAAILDENKGAVSLLPIFGGRSNKSQRKSPFGQFPLVEIISAQMGRPPSETKASGSPQSIICKAIPIIPPQRDAAQEGIERLGRRFLTNAALVSRAVSLRGGTLVDPLSVLSLIQVKSTESKASLLKRGSSEARKGLHNVVLSWTEAQNLASSALGRVMASHPREDVSEPLPIKWDDIMNAWRAGKEEEKQLRKHIKKYLPSTPTSATPVDGSPLGSSPKPPASDPVVEKIKKSRELSGHERRLLSCIVDPSKLSSTTFQDVHLPFKTIDGIRTIISLPLLFPEAFRGGVLRDHSTSGALLFGPPGTGKTLLARAVANESGARMLAIQPSDVNDKYFGEGEKLVKAVFSLARRLSPCVVFLDEVDALFGARSARGGSFGNKAHDQLLTEFMQEMDGLSSAGANRDKRVVVIGATNRPFDLDDAVLRRLPRRLLVDLPGAEDRKAIMQILLREEHLAADVDLDKLAKGTDGFSGSDLKHLCVSAALAAVKDVVSVPWRQHLAETAPIINDSQSSPSTAGITKSENFVHVPQETVVEEKKVEPEVVPSMKADESTFFSQVTMEGKLDPLASRAAPPTDTPEASTTTSKLDDSSLAADAVDKTLSADTSSSSTSSTKPLQKRILEARHFKAALLEIRPSSSEEGTLPELRKVSDVFFCFT